MTKVGNMIVKCAKCGKESSQMIVYSVNYSLGTKEDNDALLEHLQECPHCGYKAIDISMDIEEKKYEDMNIDDLIKRIDEKIDQLEKEEKQEKDEETEALNKKIAKYEKAFKDIRKILDSLDLEDEKKIQETRVEIPIVEEYRINQNRQKFDQTPGIIEDRKNDELFNDRRLISNIHRRHTLGVVEKPNISTLEEHYPKKEEKKEMTEEDVVAVYISLTMNDAKYIFDIKKEFDITIKCAIDDIVETKKLDEKEYNDLLKTLFIIKKKWDNRYDGDKENEEWSVEIVTPTEVESYEGNGLYPKNWGMFKEFINILLTKFN